MGLYFSSRKIFSQYFHKFFSSPLSLLPPIETLFTCVLHFFYDISGSVEAVVSVSALFSLCVSIWIVSHDLFSGLLIFSSTVSYLVFFFFHWKYPLSEFSMSAIIFFYLCNFRLALFDIISFFIMFVLSFKSWERIYNSCFKVLVCRFCGCCHFRMFLLTVLFSFLMNIVHVFLLHLMASFFILCCLLWMLCCGVSGFCYLPLKKCRIPFW